MPACLGQSSSQKESWVGTAASFSTVIVNICSWLFHFFQPGPRVNQIKRSTSGLRCKYSCGHGSGVWPGASFLLTHKLVFDLKNDGGVRREPKLHEHGRAAFIKGAICSGGVCHPSLKPAPTKGLQNKDVSLCVFLQGLRQKAVTLWAFITAYDCLSWKQLEITWLHGCYSSKPHICNTMKKLFLFLIQKRFKMNFQNTSLLLTASKKYINLCVISKNGARLYT